MQTALRFYYSHEDGRPSFNAVDQLVRSAFDSSALAFLVAEAQRTYDACVAVLQILEHVQGVIREPDGSSDDSPWPKPVTRPPLPYLAVCKAAVMVWLPAG